MTLKQDIDALQHAALSVEHGLRRGGYYNRDCNSFDALVRRGQKSGVALLWDADGRLEVVDLNGGSKHCAVKETDENGVTIEHDFPIWENSTRTEKHRDDTRKIVEEAGQAYEQMHAQNFKSATTRSHERENETKGRFNPQSHSTDAARMAAELKRREDRNSAKERFYRADAIKRNEEIAARYKEFWNQKSA